MQSKAKTPNHTRQTGSIAHPKFHKSISTRPTQPNPQIDSTTPVAEEANDSMNTAIGTHSVQIRSKVRGGFRRTQSKTSSLSSVVSIRFEVRGGFRLVAKHTYPDDHTFQSALRFAVVSDDRKENEMIETHIVSIRFEVRGGFRLDRSYRWRGGNCLVSIRFEVRGGFRRQKGTIMTIFFSFNPL